MRLLTLLLSLSQAAAGQAPESNIACVERLEIPSYPPIAGWARISGTVIATVKLTADGSIESRNLAVEPSSAKLLVPAVDGALSDSVFSKTCVGKSVTLVFNFVQGDEFDRRGTTDRVSFGNSNQFWITRGYRSIQP